jgi:hypothetical protein
MQPLGTSVRGLRQQAGCTLSSAGEKGGGALAGAPFGGVVVVCRGRGRRARPQGGVAPQGRSLPPCRGGEPSSPSSVVASSPQRRYRTAVECSGDQETQAGRNVERGPRTLMVTLALCLCCWLATFAGRVAALADCTFDASASICGWTVSGSGSGNLLWTRNTGYTSSGSTGPSGAQGGSYYMYLEASGGPGFSPSSGTSDNLYSPVFAASSTSISFYYHMHGTTTDRLALYSQQGSGGLWILRWSKTGQQHSSSTSSWSYQSVNIPSGTTRVFFNGRVGSSWTGDMALDTIRFIRPCTGNQGSIVSAPTTISLTSYTANNDCYWTLACSTGLRPRLSFTSFNTETNYDWVYLCACAKLMLCCTC